MNEARKIAFQKEILEYKDLVLKNLHLCVAGITKVGVRNIINLLEDELKDQFDFIYNDDGRDQSLFELLDSLQPANKTVLILSSNFSERDLEFKKNFQKVLLKKWPFKLSSVIGIDIKTYKNLESEFAITIKPITTLKILKPRTLSQLEYLIREKDQSLKKYAKEIFLLTDGIPGLMKRWINVFSELGEATSSNLNNNYATKLVLNKLEQEFNLLTSEERKLFGLVNEQGKINSILLENYIQDDSLNIIDELKQYFIDKKGMIISHDEIDDLISKDKEFSLWNRYKVIERVKKSLNGKYKIKSVHGRGYVLKND
ncbi:hypothetical protein KC678_02045 [Candidatus Dojkabacteria bacterium]|uniref:Uncharacterized protein n=1 Tax=Candidatus Dojkabacteria bacterium TaxID=2099670 RepID=A0A955IAZ9_9BACT|nr:hypothetical protein [Candidatus Dojkabacteria bacterium]